jgi:transposase
MINDNLIKTTKTIALRKLNQERLIYLYEIFCAILYLLKTGCQWRMRPKDFQWGTVYS